MPSAVVQQTLNEKIKAIKAQYDRKVFQKEKQALREEITQTLLCRAFSKLSRIYALINTKQQWLLIATTSPAKLEQYLALFKKTFPEMVWHHPETQKIPPRLTQWLSGEKGIGTFFTIEQSCLLNDPKQASRIIRCQQQDLSVSGIQSLLKDGYQVQRLALNWQDKIRFTLTDEFTLQSIQYSDEIRDFSRENGAETPVQRFKADCYLMTQLLSELLEHLFRSFSTESKKIPST